jgi:hypothetical protein
MSDLMLDVDQAGELKAAFRRGNWTNAKIKKLSEGDILSQVLLVLEGKAKIVVELLMAVGTFLFSAVKGKKTAECFTGEIFGYRDSDLDKWLPKNQPDQEASKFIGRQLSQPATFKQAVENFLGVSGDIDFLAKTLKERGHITTLSVIESQVERQEAGEDVGLLTNGYVNFFFVEDKDGSVSVVRVFRDVRQWGVYVGGLGVDFRWNAGDRFFFCN